MGALVYSPAEGGLGEVVQDHRARWDTPRHDPARWKSVLHCVIVAVFAVWHVLLKEGVLAGLRTWWLFWTILNGDETALSRYYQRPAHKYDEASKGFLTLCHQEGAHYASSEQKPRGGPSLPCTSRKMAPTKPPHKPELMTNLLIAPSGRNGAGEYYPAIRAEKTLPQALSSIFTAPTNTVLSRAWIMKAKAGQAGHMKCNPERRSSNLVGEGTFALMAKHSY